MILFLPLLVITGIAVAISVSIYLLKRSLRAALASLIGLLATFVGAMVAPSIEGEAHATVPTKIGYFALDRIQVTSSPPNGLWYVIGVGLLLLVGYALYLVARASESDKYG